MEIEFKSKKLKETCESNKKARKKWGERNAERVMRRLNEIQAAECLADLNHAPPTRCHLLEPRHRGIYAVDVQHPCRLIFLAVADDGQPMGNCDPAQVTRVNILEVKDYHD